MGITLLYAYARHNVIGFLNHTKHVIHPLARTNPFHTAFLSKSTGIMVAARRKTSAHPPA